MIQGGKGETRTPLVLHVLQRYSSGTPPYSSYSNTPFVLHWYSTGTPLVLQRYSNGTPTVLQLFFGVHGVSLFPPCVKLFEQFQCVKQNIHLVLNDSMNTEGVLKIIHGLILEVQDYVSRKADQVNIYLLKLIRDYVIDLMNIFDVSFTDN